MTHKEKLSAAAVWAGLTAFIWYAFGAVPLHIAVSQQLNLTVAQTGSWIFIVWFSGALATIALSLRFRQPIPITWTIPGLVYLGALGERFSFPELVGANLVAGLVLLGLGLLGVGARLMKWLPLPIVMGMFAGSILPYVTRMVSASVEDGLIAGVAVASYFAGRLFAHPRVPPVGCAVVGGAITVALSAGSSPQSIEWALPELAFAPMSFSGSAIVAVSLPMVIFAIGLGNVQGLGFLAAQGYSVPSNTVSTAVGATSIVNAFFGGHAATVARTGVAILASTEAGPQATRYQAAIVSAVLTITLALAATPVASLLAILPPSYIFAIAGLAIFASLQDALEKSFSGDLRFGALSAFVVAATSFSALGVSSVFWALPVGIVASVCVERRQLFTFWAAAAAPAKPAPLAQQPLQL
jgi:benzoate membrane transport protein